MGPVFLYNTLTRKKEEFLPLEPGQVGIYTCGPTVYDRATIANMRTYVFADILARVLEYSGLQVTTVMNVTDVGHLVSDADEGEDKMLVTARLTKKTPWEIAEENTEAFFRDTERLHIKRPTHVTPATEHIPQMLHMVSTLVDRGFAYETGDGIYFDISRFPEYGRLSGIDLEKQLAGARVAENPEKRHPADFAVWKKAPKEHIMQWDSPWGKGYPGWHIECSAMAREYLGDQFDIHTGGIDHIPIHHENEIAQSYGCTGKIPARVWMHAEFLTVDGGRMGKSLGNAYLLDDLVQRGFEPLAYRYFCLSAHYRSRLTFTWEALSGAAAGLRSLRSAIKKAAEAPPGVDREARAEELRASFGEAALDDLNMPRALAVLWDATRSGLGPTIDTLARDFDRVLALDLLSSDEGGPLSPEDLPASVQKLLSERSAARAKKDWATSDRIRDELRQMGYVVKDTKEGYDVTRM